MTDDTLTTPEPFDQHGIEQIAEQQLKPIMQRSANVLPELVEMGRKLHRSRSAITRAERLSLYFKMMELRLNGVLVLPERVMSDFVARVMVYEAICRRLYVEVAGERP